MVYFPSAPQTMLGRKSALGVRAPLVAVYDFYVPGSGTVLVPRNCQGHIFLWGAAASGDWNGGGSARGGGPGAAVYKYLRLSGGQVIAYLVGIGGGAPPSDATPGNNGTGSTVTLPDGRILSAGPGRASGGAAAIASGGDINRDGQMIVGTDGGSAPTFEDMVAGMLGGLGSPGAGTGVPLPGGFPGGGSGAAFGGGSNVGAAAGANGRIVIIMDRAV